LKQIGKKVGTAELKTDVKIIEITLKNCQREMIFSGTLSE